MWSKRCCAGLLSGLALIGTAVMTSVSAQADAAALPDGRAFEWVSPTLDGPPVAPAGSFGGQGEWQVTASGNRVEFQAAQGSVGDAADGTASGLHDSIVATRSASGWQDSTVAPVSTQPEAGFNSVGGTEISADLSQALIETDQPLVAGAPAGENIYLRDASGDYTLVTDAAEDGPLIPGFGFTVLEAPTFSVSADFTHIFFNPLVSQLAADPVTSGGNLYQWAGGQISIVNVLPDGSYGQQPAQLAGGQVLPAVSADGNDVLFQEQGSGPLYLRIDGQSTVQVDSSQRTTPDANNSEEISPVGITADGANVLFLDSAELTDDANTGSSDNGQDLYDYDVASGTLIDLTPDPADANGAHVVQVLGASLDGSYVYFSAQGDLAAGATSGQDNMYVEHDGQISFVTDQAQLPFEGGIYVTPDGHYFVFTATGDVTGYAATDANTGQADAEVYEYDGTSGVLTCASCRPDGSQPTGNASLPDVNGVNSPQVVSDDGQRVFFQSSDAVIPAASNGLQNVYEWEADGDGSCTQAPGCVFLISPGDGDSPANLEQASPSGDDVFFDSFDALAGNDTGYDAVYDARVGGGIPAAPAPVAPCASSVTCQGAAAGATASPGAGSVGFGGPGDAVPAAAAKTRNGKVKVTGRAVKGMVVTLTLRAPARGRLTVTGAKLKRTIKAVSEAGTYRVAVKLSKQAAADWQWAVRRAKAKRRQAKVRDRVTMKVNYKPATGKGSAVTLSVELKG